MFDEARKTPPLPRNGLLTGILIAAILYFGREVFIPIALAGLLSFLLAPAANRLEQWKFRRGPATIVLVVLVLAVASAIGWLVINQTYNLFTELPRYQYNITAKVESLHLKSAGRMSNTVNMLTAIGKEIAAEPSLEQTTPAFSEQHQTSPRVLTPIVPAAKPSPPVLVKVEPPDETMATIAQRTLLPLWHVLGTVFIVVIFLIFILNGRDDLSERGFRLAGRSRMHVTSSAVADASDRVSRYLRTQLVVNLCYGAAAGTALWIIGVPNPYLWGILVSVLRFIPYVGILMAGTCPLILAIAVSPGWGQPLWTAATFFVLEVTIANFIEPMLYGVSAGISPIAILVAALFWTLLWGFPGLLISTPLTVCLVVLGRQIPQLEFFHLLLGEDTVLTGAERFYRRVLAYSSREAAALLRGELEDKARDQVYDEVVVPTLSMIEEARHAEEMTGERAENVLTEIEELIEEVRDASLLSSEASLEAQIVCVPCRDSADEVACNLAADVLGDVARIQILSQEMTLPNLLSSLEESRPAVVCVIGIPPNAIRHMRMRCHQIRSVLPEVQIVACLPSGQSELPDLRSRIPTEDAQHVVSSLQLLKSYLTAVLHPEPPAAEEEPQPEDQVEARKELNEGIQEIEKVEASDVPPGEAFTRMITNLARSLDAPIALIQSCDGEKRFWEAQCGIPETDTVPEPQPDFSLCRKQDWSDTPIILCDTQNSAEFAGDPFIRSKGIRFCAAAPLKTFEGRVIGSVSVFDTRPRQISEEQKETLISLADAVMNAIELRETAGIKDSAAQTAENNQQIPAAK